MELDQILQLIDKVSDSSLTAFDYEADGIKIAMEHGKAAPVQVQMRGCLLYTSAPSASATVSFTFSNMFLSSLFFLFFLFYMGVSYHSRYAAPQISPAPKPERTILCPFWALPDRFHSSSRIGIDVYQRQR